jgi:hypothetical protein
MAVVLHWIAALLIIASPAAERERLRGRRLATPFRVAEIRRPRYCKQGLGDWKASVCQQSLRRFFAPSFDYSRRDDSSTNRM